MRSLQNFQGKTVAKNLVQMDSKYKYLKGEITVLEWKMNFEILKLSSNSNV
uniref:Uncharacterized protein n=1 Tax=Solanum lycopersicum TaxID=4081 RepID=A0A3Q7GKR2_SOLLC